MHVNFWSLVNQKSVWVNNNNIINVYENKEGIFVQTSSVLASRTKTQSMHTFRRFESSCSPHHIIMIIFLFSFVWLCGVERRPLLPTDPMHCRLSLGLRPFFIPLFRTIFFIVLVVDSFFFVSFLSILASLNEICKFVGNWWLNMKEHGRFTFSFFVLVGSLFFFLCFIRLSVLLQWWTLVQNGQIRTVRCMYEDNIRYYVMKLFLLFLVATILIYVFHWNGPK